MSTETLTIVDNRTGFEYLLPIVDGTIRATDLRQLTAADGDGGLMSYDPAYLNTSSCRSAITYIDGDAGILRYRGYPIEQVAEHASFLETAYLLLEGRLPAQHELSSWEDDVRLHTYVHTNFTKFLDGFRYDAHPMGMLLGAVGALSTFYPDAKEIGDPAGRHLQRVRLIAKMPTIAAFVFRHSRGLPYVFPRNDLDYIGNFVNMTFEIHTRAVSPRSVEVEQRRRSGRFVRSFGVRPADVARMGDNGRARRAVRMNEVRCASWPSRSSAEPPFVRRFRPSLPTTQSEKPSWPTRAANGRCRPRCTSRTIRQATSARCPHSGAATHC